MQEDLVFKVPVRAGDTVHAKVSVSRMLPEKRLVFLDTVCLVRDTVVITGEALVRVGSRA
jgi:3-hydroxybutyryl-CoA dehydratase